jgi:putative sterol carrier protein
MAAIFPSPEWLQIFGEKLNTDEHYSQVARNWEADLCFVIEPSGPITERILYYLDLWHGKCRRTEILKELPTSLPKFVLTATYENFSHVLKGKVDPMQAMLTRKLQVHGSMAYMARNIPVVLDFVRCARDVTTEIL